MQLSIPWSSSVLLFVIEVMVIVHSLKCTVPFSFAVPLNSLAVTHCHSLSLVVNLCYSLYHSLSLFVIVCHSLCHSLSLVVILCHSMYTFYKRSTVIARLPRTTQPIFPRLLYFAVISVTSRLVKQFMKNPENIDHIALGTVEWINCSIMKDRTIVFLTFCFSFLSDKR